MALSTVQIQGADGSTHNVLLDSVSGNLYPIYKLTTGALGSAGNIVSPANPLPIFVGNSGGTEVGTAASPFYVALSDGSVSFELDPPTGYVVVIDTLHHKIHEGEAFSAINYFGSVAKDATAMLRVLTPAGVNYHFTFGVTSELIGEVEFLEGTTYSGDGTTVTERNNDRTSASTSGASVYHTPTVNVDGTTLSHFLLPAGGTPAKSGGGAGGERNEWILNPSTDYLVRVTNRGSVAGDISIACEWYEVTP